jgi:hypothetical protein
MAKLFFFMQENSPFEISPNFFVRRRSAAYSNRQLGTRRPAAEEAVQRDPASQAGYRSLS